MMFAVKIKEIRERIVYVDCDYDFEALRDVENKYDDGRYLLDDDYIKNVEIEVMED